MRKTALAACLLGSFFMCEAQSIEPPGKEKDKLKISMVARASPALREHFREMYTQTFSENLNETSLNKLLDDQIDSFVRQLVQKNAKLADFAAELTESLNAGSLKAAAQRQTIRKIRETADDLDGILRIWTDSLRPEKKGKEENPVQTPTPRLLVEQVSQYQKQVNRFLFPEDVAVSVKELQSEGFHWALKKIKGLAQTLERH